MSFISLLWACPSVPMSLKMWFPEQDIRFHMRMRHLYAKDCHLLIFRTLCFSSRSWELLVFLADVSVHCWLMLGLWSIKKPNDILKECLLLFPPLVYKRKGLWKNIERLKKNWSLTSLSFILPSYPFLCLNFFLNKIQTIYFMSLCILHNLTS